VRATYTARYGAGFAQLSDFAINDGKKHEQATKEVPAEASQQRLTTQA